MRGVRRVGGDAEGRIVEVVRLEETLGEASTRQSERVVGVRERAVDAVLVACRRGDDLQIHPVVEGRGDGEVLPTTRIGIPHTEPGAAVVVREADDGVGRVGLGTTRATPEVGTDVPVLAIPPARRDVERSAEGVARSTHRIDLSALRVVERRRQATAVDGIRRVVDPDPEDVGAAREGADVRPARRLVAVRGPAGTGDRWQHECCHRDAHGAEVGGNDCHHETDRLHQDLLEYGRTRLPRLVR